MKCINNYCDFLLYGKATTSINAQISSLLGGSGKQSFICGQFEMTNASIGNTCCPFFYFHTKILYHFHSEIHVLLKISLMTFRNMPYLNTCGGLVYQICRT